MAGTTGSARQEAERLVATVLAMAAQSGLGAAARGPGTGGLGDLVNGVVGQFLGGSGQQHKAGSGSGWATGSAECCVCPVCKAIAATRDPSPERAERLASGAGDLATGVASMLRGFSKVASATGTKPRPKQPPRPAPTPDQAWSAATRDPKTAQEAESSDPWTAATRTPAPAPEKVVRPAPEQQESQPETEPSAGGDPWAAATRAPRRPRKAPAVTPERPGPATEGADSALPEMPGSAGVAGDRPGARIEKSSSVFPGEGDAVGVDHDGPAGG